MRISDWSSDVCSSDLEDFYEALTAYGMCLKLALGSRSFFEDTSITERQIAEYKRDLKFFTNLRKIVKQDAQETRMRIRHMKAAARRTTHETSWSPERTALSRSDARRCGKEWVGKVRDRGSRGDEKKKTKKDR